MDLLLFLAVLNTLIEQQRILLKNRDLTELLFSLILSHRKNAADICGQNCCKHGTSQTTGRIHREIHFLLVIWESYDFLNGSDKDGRTLFIKQTSHSKNKNAYLGH